ncbi:MAG: ATP-binding domain-containing protein [Symploca sp. SIO2E6]|nr:ATP-binding domain-containing protein [Symploca sp. SIO2E6]
MSSQDRKFITTEPISKGGEAAEQLVWEAVCRAFTPRECLGYWRYPIFSKVGKYRKEPDILIADAQLGLIVIEIKAVTIDQILAITGHRWELQNFYTTNTNPYQQAEHQLFALLGYCDREPSLRRRVHGRALVCLPLITEEQWYHKGFYQLPSCPPIIFQDQLQEQGKGKIEAGTRGCGDAGKERFSSSVLNGSSWKSELKLNGSLLKLIEQTAPIIRGYHLNTEQWQLLQAVIGGTPVFRKQRPVSTTIPQNQQTRGSVLVQVRQHLSEFDLQQEHIGKEIPPGPQRIRGIAGSGKTVLLCQKAAHMHLKHPDWDIALVFFSRSLYNQIIRQLDKWLRRFSSGEVGYEPKHSKLRPLHAWGAKSQPGLYSTICRAAGVKRLNVNDTRSKQPNEALAEVCIQLLKETSIPQLYNAILIDEGQDLIVDDHLKFEGKQPFYWLAYQALRPVGPSQPEQRRLIWAYDEAQSLESLNIPNASELFGEELGHLVTGYYGGGIRKSEIMHRCYRTPGPILTAAHGIGMGLLRRSGMLTGITRIEDWQAIGYQVIIENHNPGERKKVWGNESADAETRGRGDAENRNPTQNFVHPHNPPFQGRWGKENVSLSDEYCPKGEVFRSHLEFIPGQQITLKRPPENSPNLVPQLWKHPVLEFIAYRDRQSELTALAENIIYNLRYDGLKPSREILVIVLGSGFEAMQLETATAEFLMSQGLDIYIPSTLDCNILQPDKEHRDPNRFWCEGGVTVSRIHRAKGNEAEMVYVVGLDNVAKDDSNLQLRNQLFVALTRAKGWLKLSGVGAYPLYEEMWRVIRSGDSFTFTFRRPPEREIGVTDTSELLKRYDTGGRNFQNADLTGVQLAGADLRDANLIGAILRNANLRNAQLDGAKLVIADLTGADLSNTSLQKAKLVGGILQEVRLNGADLSRAKLGNADLRNAQLVGAKLSGADLSGADLTGVNWDQADLREVNWEGAIMPDGSVFE